MAEVTLMLNNVRITFPNLFEPKAAEAGQKPKFSASFLFAKDHPAAAELKNAIVKAAKEKWNEKADAILKELFAGNKLCLHDGDAKASYAGYAGNLFVNASNDARPLVIGADRAPLVAADGKPYSGSYVNAKVSIWAQDNKFGKRVNASLMGVQFARDGERLAGGAVAQADDFQAIAPEKAADVAAQGAAALFG